MNDTTVIVVVLIVAVLVGTLYGLPILVNTFQELRSWFASDIADLFSGNQTRTGDYLGFGVTVYYTDGSVESWEPSERYVILPLAILRDGQPISRADWDLYANLEYRGTMTSLQVTGSMTLNATRSTTTPLEERTLSQSLGVPVSGSWFKIDGFSKSAEEIEAWLAPTGTLAETVQAYADITLSATFADSNTDARHGSCNGGIHINVDVSRIELMSLQIQTATFP